VSTSGPPQRAGRVVARHEDVPRDRRFTGLARAERRWVVQQPGDEGVAGGVGRDPVRLVNASGRGLLRRRFVGGSSEAPRRSSCGNASFRMDERRIIAAGNGRCAAGG
jgi:hypothetical protein